MTSVALRKGSMTAAKLSAASLAFGTASFIFWNLLAAILLWTSGFGLSLAWMALALVAEGVRQREHETDRRQKVVERGKRRDHLERARTWRFELVGEPYPDPDAFILGKFLMNYSWMRRRLLKDAVEKPPELDVIVKFLPYNVALRDPVVHRIGSRHLFESSLPSEKPSVSFPSADVDKAGRINNYGSEAVFFGHHFGFPAWKDEEERLDEEPWLWQVPNE